ncbi:hypothetical protein P7L87_25625, partial [Vibrio parahaemolyticus]|nr:hypothetical protein [Vibrio parahaemolyticus]
MQCSSELRCSTSLSIATQLSPDMTGVCKCLASRANSPVLGPPLIFQIWLLSMRMQVRLAN